MVERAPLTVEARFAPDGTVTPLAVMRQGHRRVVASVGRQWTEGARRCFDVQLDGGETVLLFLEARPPRWYASGTRGFAKMV